METQAEIFGAGPVLPVHDVAAAVQYYVEVLGFAHDLLSGDPPPHGSVTRGRVGIQFTCVPDRDGTQGTRSYSGWTYIWVTDADSLCEEYRSRGARITFGPESGPHGMREFEIADPHGHRLRFGQYLEG